MEAPGGYIKGERVDWAKRQTPTPEGALWSVTDSILIDGIACIACSIGIIGIVWIILSIVFRRVSLLLALSDI